MTRRVGSISGASNTTGLGFVSFIASPVMKVAIVAERITQPRRVRCGTSAARGRRRSTPEDAKNS